MPYFETEIAAEKTAPENSREAAETFCNIQPDGRQAATCTIRAM